MISKYIGKISTMVKAYAMIALAFIAVTVPLAATHATTTYDFSSSTAEAVALRNELLAQATTIALGTLAAFIGFALIFMAAKFVWKKFQKWTKMRGQL